MATGDDMQHETPSSSISDQYNRRKNSSNSQHMKWDISPTYDISRDHRPRKIRIIRNSAEWYSLSMISQYDSISFHGAMKPSGKQKPRKRISAADTA